MTSNAPQSQSPSPGDAPTPIQRVAMRDAIFHGCFSALTVLAFTNGLILLLLTTLGINSERIVVYLSLPLIAGAVFKVPFAVLSDRFGKKRMGIVGASTELVAWALLCGSTMLSEPGEWMIAGALLIYSLGLTQSTSSWFALLSPIVPESIRGRFFSQMRFTWQSVNVVFASGCALYLSDKTPMPVFTVILGLLTISLIFRLVFYMRIPEIEPVSDQPLRVFHAIGQIIRVEGFMSFCAYMFLITLATGSVRIVFGLIEKKVLNYGDDMVIWLGNLYMVGALTGFAVGGRMVDRYGTKPVFLIAHFGYALSLIIFVSRMFWPNIIGPTFVPVAIADTIFGFMWAFASIAVSTQMLALIPNEYKSLSTSVCMTFMRIGGALSGLLTAWILTLGALSDQWNLAGHTLSRYDSILMFCAIGIMLLVVTLGLVPSVIHKAQWVPRQY